MFATDETATVEGGVNGVVLLGSARDSEISGDARLPRSALALLAYLLLEGRGERASREEAGAFLWESIDCATQFGNLRQLLFRIRAAEAAANMRLLEITRTEIVLNPRNVSIDLRDFQAAIGSAGGANAATAASEAYGGELLAGLTAPGEELKSWLAAERAKLRADFLGVLTPYVEAQANGPVEDAAIVAASRILEIDSRHETAYRVLIQAYRERGDEARADQYRNQCERIQEIRSERPLTRAIVAESELVLAKSASAKGATNWVLTASRRPQSGEGPPRVVVSTHAPSYAPAAGRERVMTLGADLATRLAQVRALTVLSVETPTEQKAITAADYFVEVRLAEDQVEAVQLRLLTAPDHEIFWAASFADSSPYFKRAPITVNSICVISRIARSRSGTAPKGSASPIGSPLRRRGCSTPSTCPRSGAPATC